MFSITPLGGANLVGTAAFTGGNGNGSVDPNECNSAHAFDSKLRRHNWLRNITATDETHTG
jgi:hypothetical protein